MIAKSYDGADSFSLDDFTFDPNLNDSAIAAGLLYHNGVMFFSNPNSQTASEYRKRLDIFGHSHVYTLQIVLELSSS